MREERWALDTVIGKYKPFTPRGTKGKHHGWLCRQEEGDDSRLFIFPAWLIHSRQPHLQPRAASSCLGASMVTSFSADNLI